MSSLQRNTSIAVPFSEFLVHHEENPRPEKLIFRHPFVVFFHIPYVIALTFTHFVLSQQTLGQTIYFTAIIGLYLSSAAYHAGRPNNALRIIDQIMISAYIMSIPMPFLYHEPLAILAFCICLILVIRYKCREQEEDWKAGALVFVGLGAVSWMLVVVFGLPIIGQSLFSLTSLWVMIATAFFISKFIVYRYEIKWIPKFWEAPEMGHFLLSIGATIYSYLVIIYPV